MPYLDTVRILLVPGIDITSHDTVASKIWDATLQYILHLEGLVECYASQQLSDDQVWIVVVWGDKQSQDRFRNSTIGVGIMVPFMKAPPQVFSIPEISEDVLREHRELSVQYYRFGKSLAEGDMSDFQARWTSAWHPRVAHCAWQTGDANAFMSHDEEPIFFGVITDIDTPRQDPNMRIEGPVNDFQSCLLTLVQPVPRVQGTVPVRSTPELLHAGPDAYGITPLDDTNRSNETYPSNLSLQPMLNLANSSWFPYDSDYLSKLGPLERRMDIITIYFTVPLEDLEASVFPAICKEVATQPGLGNLYWCKDEHNPRIVRFILAWEDASSCSQYRSFVAGQESRIRSRPYIEKDPKFTTFPIEHLLDWGEKCDIEALDFYFPTKLSKAEKSAFVWYLNRFLRTMTPSSSDTGKSTVVHPTGPFWFPKEPEDGYLVWLSWDSLPLRQQWLTNFLENTYDVAGHVSHVLGVVCPVAKSSTVTMYKINQDKY